MTIKNWGCQLFVHLSIGRNTRFSRNMICRQRFPKKMTVWLKCNKILLELMVPGTRLLPLDTGNWYLVPYLVRREYQVRRNLLKFAAWTKRLFRGCSSKASCLVLLLVPWEYHGSSSTTSTKICPVPVYLLLPGTRSSTIIPGTRYLVVATR